MNRLLQVSFTALVLMCQLVGAQSSPQTAQPIASPPTGLALEVTYLKSLAPTFSPVGGPCCKPVGAWYALFGRIQASATSQDRLPVNAVDVRSRLEGEFVRVTVSVFRGPLHEKKDQVAIYKLRENEGLSADELADFGVEPFNIKVVRVNPILTNTPSVITKAQSVAVVGIELKKTTLPGYKLTVHNTANKNVVAMGINVLENNRLRGSSLPQGRAGLALIKVGETSEISVGGYYRTQNTPEGYRPEQPTNQEIVITSVVFDDGSFEGDAKMAATFTAFVAGRKLQIAKLIGLIDSTASLTDVTVGSALERLKEQADMLSTDADPAVLDHLRQSFPQLTSSEKETLKSAVDVALNAVKFDFVNCVKEFEKRNPQLSDPQFRAWLSATRLSYERWLLRLANGSSHL